MKKLKVMTVVGTRPEIIRLSRVMAKLDEHTDHLLVHTGQNYDYELNEIFFNDLEIRKPDYFLNSALTVQERPRRSASLIIAVDGFWQKFSLKPCWCWGTPTVASLRFRQKEKDSYFSHGSGNRCFDQRVPEETNRRIVDHTSDINLTYSSIAREYLLGRVCRRIWSLRPGARCLRC